MSSSQQQQRQPSEEGEVVVVTGGTTVVEGDHAEEDQEEAAVSSTNPDMSHVSVVVLGEASIQVIDSSLTTGIYTTLVILWVCRWDGVS